MSQGNGAADSEGQGIWEREGDEAEGENILYSGWIEIDEIWGKWEGKIGLDWRYRTAETRISNLFRVVCRNSNK